MKLTVLLITYNHERFLRQALDSILAQQVNFDYEILISEDCSTDNTRAILNQYAGKFPEKIRLLLSPRNLNDNTVVERGLLAARGEYIALLDGDDYWTSSAKLQKQVDFLDAHPACAVSWHKFAYVDEQGAVLRYGSAPHTFWTLKEVIENDTIAFGTAMLRRAMLPPMPEWFKGCPLGDVPLIVLCLKHGIGGYLDEPLGAYRIHGGGVWSGATPERQLDSCLEVFRTLRSDLPDDCHSVLTSKIAQVCADLASLRKRKGDAVGSRAAAKAGLAEDPLNPKLLIFAYFPFLVTPLRSLLHSLRPIAWARQAR